MPEINNTAKDEFLKAFGANIKQLRKAKKLTQHQLAARINGDTKKIGRIERGCYDIKLVSVLILAQALEVNALELLNFQSITKLQKHIWLR